MAGRRRSRGGGPSGEDAAEETPTKRVGEAATDEKQPPRLGAEPPSRCAKYKAEAELPVDERVRRRPRLTPSASGEPPCSDGISGLV